jgi:DNA-binding SARP family transcriptional activator
MEFSLLGPVVVHSGGRLVPVRRGHQRALLAALLLEANGLVTTDKLAEVLWGSSPPPSALVTIRNYVRRLRQALGEDGRGRISAEPRGYLIRVAADELDIFKFEALVKSSQTAARGESWDQAAARAQAALALWRGEPLADVESDLLALRNVPRLTELRIQALETRVNAELHLGGHAEMVAELQQVTAAYPLREQAHALLMLALYRSGRAGEALDAYHRVRTTLREELGIEPDAELQHLFQQILHVDPALAAPSPPGSVSTVRSGSAGKPAVGTATGAASSAGSAVSEASVAAGVSDTIAPAAPGATTAATGLRRAAAQQLPGAVPGFTGRAAELAVLTEALDRIGDQAPGTVVISAVGGTAGVGKTTLAVHWAHGAAARFPDGQLYANLRGYDPSSAPVAPTEALDWFLDALGVAAESRPPSLEARAGLYRSLLAGKRLLIVLDNARDADQVRPLLPAAAGCLVLVTSRARLSSLAVREGARLLSLDVLTETEARQMLAGRLGKTRVRAEPEPLDELIALCARLPLALAIIAARAAARPQMPLSDLAAELADAGSRLDVLEGEDTASNLRAVMSWSYQQLTPAAARMFRLLGLHPGPDVSVPTAASLAGISVSEGRRQLAELAAVSLLTEHKPGRFVFHDLLRSYAREQAHTAESDQAQRAAVSRMLDHYLQTAHAATVLVQPQRDSLALMPRLAGVTAQKLANRRAALAWFEAEYHGLLAAITLAAQSGLDACTWQLAWATYDFFLRRGHWREWAACARTALDAATRIGDKAGKAWASRNLGYAYGRLGNYHQARANLARSLGLYRDLGDQTGEALAHQNLGWVAERQGRHGELLIHARRALTLHQAAGNQRGQAQTLNTVGWAYLLLRRPWQARPYCEQALTMNRELGMRAYEAASWDSLGYAEYQLGRYQAAVACYCGALNVARELGDVFSEAQVLDHLGDAYQAVGRLQPARDAWLQALGLFAGLQVPEANRVRAKLGSSGAHAIRPDREAATNVARPESWEHSHVGHVRAGYSP